MWEALTAIGTIASAVVIAVTVVMAARQVKITSDQLEQTRRAAQFGAARTVLLEMVEPRFVSAYRFIIHEFHARMEDPEFYRGIGQIGLADDAEREVRPRRRRYHLQQLCDPQRMTDFFDATQTTDGGIHS